MPGLNGNDIVEFRLAGTLFGQKVLNVFHYRVEFDSGLPTYAQAIKAAADGFGVGTNNPTLALLACACAAYTLDGIWAQRIYPTRDRGYYSAFALPGTNAGTCGSGNQSATIEKWSWVGTRHGIGATHVPGVPQESQVDGKWNNAYTTLLTALAGKIATPYSPPTDTACVMTPVILNRAAKAASVALNGTSVQSTVRVMRRRTIGVGK